MVQPPNAASMVTQQRNALKLAGVAGGDGGIARAIKVLRRDFLSLRGIQILQIFLGHLARAVLIDILVDHADRRLRDDADRGRDDIEFAGTQLLDRQVGLVFPGQQHIADTAFDECHGRAARAGIEHRHIVVQLFHEGLRRGVVAPGLLQGPGPGGQIIPARSARGLRTRRDDRDAGPHQVAPIMDVLRVALAHQEYDGRGIGRAVVRQPVLPARGNQAALCRQRVDVVGQGQRHHVGLQAIDHGARLFAGSAMALIDDDRIAGLALPVRGKRLVVFLVELARRVIGDVQEFHRGRRRRRRAQTQRQQGARENRP